MPHAPYVNDCAVSDPSVESIRFRSRVHSIDASADCTGLPNARRARTGASRAASFSSRGTVKGSMGTGVS